MLKLVIAPDRSDDPVMATLTVVFLGSDDDLALEKRFVDDGGNATCLAGWFRPIRPTPGKTTMKKYKERSKMSTIEHYLTSSTHFNNFNINQSTTFHSNYIHLQAHQDALHYHPRLCYRSHRRSPRGTSGRPLLLR